MHQMTSGAAVADANCVARDRLEPYVNTRTRGIAAMSGLDLNTVMQVVELAAAFETGGASLALEEAEQQAMQQVATQAFSGALSQLGASGNQSEMLNAFTAGYGAGSSLSGGGDSALTQQLLDSAYRNGGLANSSQNLQDQMASLIDQLGGQGQQTDGSSGSGSSNGGSVSGAGNNWMEAIAKAMGEALGNLSQKVVDESQQLNSLAGNSSSSGAQQFQSVMAEFQADSQTLSMLSNAFATAIKSIGEGMQTMASKQ
jgi:hypothetical protein